MAVMVFIESCKRVTRQLWVNEGHYLYQVKAIMAVRSEGSGTFPLYFFPFFSPSSPFSVFTSLIFSSWVEGASVGWLVLVPSWLALRYSPGRFQLRMRLEALGRPASPVRLSLSFSFPSG